MQGEKTKNDVSKRKSEILEVHRKELGILVNQSKRGKGGIHKYWY